MVKASNSNGTATADFKAEVSAATGGIGEQSSAASIPSSMTRNEFALQFGLISLEIIECGLKLRELQARSDALRRQMLGETTQ
jgi:hypothetical protein